MMLYCLIYIIFLAVSKAEPTIDFKNPSSIQEALKNATFQDIIISASSTYLLTSLTEEEDTVKIVIKDEDLDDAYLNIINELNNKDQSHVEKRHRNAFTKKDDYYRLFRTYLVLSWIFTTGFVIFLFTSNTFTRYFLTYDYYSDTYNPYLPLYLVSCDFICIQSDW
ncbi:glycosyltransferase family 2 protein [Gigaspora margarita]|uniref:Glycosyltransferase family 2 protein n=1 Tax=Gigaspora margarita TaxID=4874 RepID=A0A8H4EQM3_GIGMA|nr:glycosyltransferase family 2 protein [Gigaspora margarita]